MGEVLASNWYGGAHVDGVYTQMLRDSYEPFIMSDEEARDRVIQFELPCLRCCKNPALGATCGRGHTMCRRCVKNYQAGCESVSIACESAALVPMLIPPVTSLTILGDLEEDINIFASLLP